MPTTEEVAAFRAKVEALLGGSKAFTALAGQRIKIGVEIGRQVNQWMPRIPYAKRGDWFAENLPSINRCIHGFNAWLPKWRAEISI
ncbi:hypothetical protein FEM03_21300 [Phragmitibacter flavus]|uniref:Uncharacterized protein n=1 Tax=Phragmitibacter flavus TaxID=2576071 RepID=A0A5R8K8V2_9BACT|nr:hypothetical protein [Phragmitibacter flavus]TLD68721.1 hypothetical protein FEM03_21300 [Phragmitibacter flavus]